MEQTEINNQVSQKLMEFESLGLILPSEDWNKSLTERLSSVRPGFSSIVSSAKFAIAVLLISIINVGFILTVLFNDSQQDTRHNTELQIISNELLINPNTINK